MQRSKPCGQPRKGINTRVSDVLRDQLVEAAAESNRTVGAEIEARLSQSFGARPASAEDVRLMIREELRAVLDEMDARRLVPIDDVVRIVGGRRSETEQRLTSPGNGPNLVG